MLEGLFGLVYSLIYFSYKNPFPDIINQVKIDYQNNFNSNFFEALDSQNLFF